MIDLILQHENDNEIKKGIESLNLFNASGKYKKGDVISFYGGCSCDILYKSVITGFDNDGDIYVLWDCYWFPIKDDAKRKIKLIKRNHKIY